MHINIETKWPPVRSADPIIKSELSVLHSKDTGITIQNPAHVTYFMSQSTFYGQICSHFINSHLISAKMAAMAPVSSMYHFLRTFYRSLGNFSPHAFPRSGPLRPCLSHFRSLCHTHNPADSYPSLLIHILIHIFPMFLSLPPSFTLSISLFCPLQLSESHMFLLKRLGPANETQSLIQSRVSPFFFQTSLKIRARKAGVFSPPSLSPSLIPSLSLPRAVSLALMELQREPESQGSCQEILVACFIFWLVQCLEESQENREGTKADQARLQVSSVNVCIKSLAPVLRSSSPGPVLRLPACS